MADRRRVNKLSDLVLQAWQSRHENRGVALGTETRAAAV
jgi:hypothetical protein